MKKGKQALICILFFISSLLLVYPSLSDARASIRQVTELAGYALAAASMTQKEADREIAAAEAYNRTVEKEQRGMPFCYRGEDASDEIYQKALAFDGGIMAYLEIPKLGLYLPIAHGTRTEELAYECGHLYGTSLPVGGPSVHSVIAGHTGLPTAELFTRLTELGEGERFSIHLPGRVHIYEVCAVRVVWPREESRYLQIEKGKDLITLYTCTPYGINDRRLLVTGERRGTELSPSGDSSETMKVESIRRGAVLRFALLLAVPSATALIGIFCLLRRPRRGNGSFAAGWNHSQGEVTN